MNQKDQLKSQAKQIHEKFDAARTKGFVTFAANPDTRPQSPEFCLLKEKGFVVLRDVLSTAQCGELRLEIDRIADSETRQRGRNSFEGRLTRRPYGILGKSRAFDSLAEHPLILGLLDQLLLPDYLITTTQAIQILPGENPQPLHYDDAFCNVPRPRQAFSVATIWAIDDFTPENGGTIIYPKSHLWGDRVPSVEDEHFALTMEKGSVAVFLGTLWHGGGPNTANSVRTAVT
jgi:hypothetical protein